MDLPGKRNLNTILKGVSTIGTELVAFHYAELAQLGRALVLQTRGHWFDPSIPHHHGLGRLGVPYSAQLRSLGEKEVRDNS